MKPMGHCLSRIFFSLSSEQASGLYNAVVPATGPPAKRAKAEGRRDFIDKAACLLLTTFYFLLSTLMLSTFYFLP